MSKLDRPNPINPPRLEAALRSSSRTLRLRADRAWEVPPSAERTPPLLAEEDGEWLMVSAPATGDSRLDWEMLLRAGSLPPLLKLALPPGGARVVRADLAMGDPALLARRVAEAIRAFPGALSTLAGRSASGQSQAANEKPADAASRGSFEDLLEQSGWPFTARGEGKAATALEVLKGGGRQATVEHVGSGLRIAVQVGTWPQLGDECRQALGVFILSLSHALRLARGFAGVDGAGISAGFEVLLPPGPTGAEMANALCALSVACRAGAEEMLALEDSAIAGRYLRMRREITREHQ